MSMYPIPRQRKVERVSQAALSAAIQNGPIDFLSIRKCLLSWLRSKVGHNLPLRMTEGKTDALDQVDALRTETVSLDDPLCAT